MKILQKNTYKTLLLLLVLCTACVEQNYGITSEVIPLTKGFGYVIRIEEKVVIKQTFIPAVQGNVPFCTEQDAQRTADLVTKKMIESKGPSVTLEELKQLQIDFNCVHLL
ncbi:hypothetical protein KORDIASMS9_01439 [Kordia sp. SMS9]|uniref:DUF4907 domain-containing protein n=1 Tax=Kordia sp. SMS9 TaxID=2282170 RepID=UPI000E0CC408|nr:DUF4907 domain-containing protein [Kordia sp. SMS9]AXG69219.1 hypothetical protein KORDIASMS9_01439 [Kordia sp. SMS9]